MTKPRTYDDETGRLLTGPGSIAAAAGSDPTPEPRTVGFTTNLIAAKELVEAIDAVLRRDEFDSQRRMVSVFLSELRATITEAES